MADAMHADVVAVEAALPPQSVGHTLTAADVMSISDALVRDKIIAALILLGDKDRLAVEKTLADKHLERLSGQLEKTILQKDNLKRQVEQLQGELHDKSGIVHKLTEQRDQFECTTRKLESQLELRDSEKLNHTRLCDSLKERIVGLEAQVTRLQEHNHTLALEKCTLQVRVDEVETLERDVKARERRVDQEKQLLTKDKEWALAEVDRREGMLRELRRENYTLRSDYELRLLRASDEQDRLKSDCERLDRQVNELTTQVDSLNERLRASTNEASEQRVHYEQEIVSLSSACDEYKQLAETADAECARLVTAVRDTQALVDEARTTSDAMGEQWRVQDEQYRVALAAKDDELTAAHEELARANELLSSKHRVLLSDEEIAQISPGAAAMSRLLKSNTSLTSIYSEHVKLFDELEKQKSAYRTLEQQMRSVVSDVENVAPVMQRYKQQLNEQREMVERLKDQLHRLTDDQRQMRTSLEYRQRELQYTKQELERTQTRLRDTTHQLNHLLVGVERQRKMHADDQRSEQDMSMAGARASPDDLLLFNNIEELQELNARLTSELRDAEARRDEMVQAAQQQQMSEMQHKLENALRDVQSMSEHNSKQERVLELMNEDRERWKAMYEQIKASNNVDTTLNFTVLERGAAASMPESPMMARRNSATPNSAGDGGVHKEALERQEREYQLYKREAGERERMHQAKIDALQADVTKLTAVNAKLESEMIYHQERFAVLVRNSDTAKDQLRASEERCTVLKTREAGYERQIQQTRDMLFDVQEQLSRVKVECQSLTDKLRLNETQAQRLQSELDVERQQSKQNDKLMEQLKALNSRVQYIEANKSIEKDEAIERLTSERDALRRQLAQNTEQMCAYVDDARSKHAQLKSDLDVEILRTKQLQSELVTQQTRAADTAQHAATLADELAHMKSAHEESTTGPYRRDNDQLTSRLRYTELQLNEAREQMKAKDEALTRAQAELTKHQRTSASFESTLTKSRQTSTETEQSLRIEVATLQEHLLNLGADSERVRAELVVIQAQLAQVRQAKDMDDKSHADQMQQLQRSLNDSRTLLRRAETSLSEKEQDLQTVTGKLATTVALVDELREENNSLVVRVTVAKELEERLSNDLGTTRNELESVTSTLAETKTGHETEVANLIRAREQCERQVQEASTKVEDLTEEVSKLANALAVYERVATVGGGTVTNGAELAAAGDSAVARLNEAMKYLRADCSEARAAKLEAEVEVQRLRSREGTWERALSEKQTEIERLERSEQQLKMVQAERAELTEKLGVLTQTRAELDAANRQRVALDTHISALESTLMEKQSVISDHVARLALAQRQFDDANASLARLDTELAEWKAKHAELMNERAAIDPTEMSRLRRELAVKSEQVKTLTQESARRKQEAEEALTGIDTMMMERDQLSMQLETIKEEKVQLEKKTQATVSIGRLYRDDVNRLVDLCIKHVVPLPTNLSQHTLKRVQAIRLEEGASAAGSASPAQQSDTSIDAVLQQQKLVAAEQETQRLSASVDTLRTSLDKTADQLKQANVEKEAIRLRCDELSAELMSVKQRLRDVEQQLSEKTVRLALVEKESSERQNELQVLRDLRDRLRAELAELTRVHEQQVNKPVVAVSVPIVASVTPTQQSDAAVAAPTSTTSAQSSSRLPQPAQTRKINLAQAHRAPVVPTPQATACPIVRRPPTPTQSLQRDVPVAASAAVVTAGVVTPHASTAGHSIGYLRPTLSAANRASLAVPAKQVTNVSPMLLHRPGDARKSAIAASATAMVAASSSSSSQQQVAAVQGVRQSDAPQSHDEDDTDLLFSDTDGQVSETITSSTASGAGVVSSSPLPLSSMESQRRSPPKQLNASSADDPASLNLFGASAPTRYTTTVDESLIHFSPSTSVAPSDREQRKRQLSTHLLLDEENADETITDSGMLFDEPESSQSSVKRARHSPPDTQLTAAAASHVQQNNTVSTSGEQQVVQPTPATTRIHPRPSAVYRDFMTADDPTSTPMFERVERAVEEEMGSVDEEPYLKAADAALHEFENALDSDAQSNEGGGEDDDGQPQQQEDVVLVDDDDENDFDDDDDESDMPSTNGDRSLLRTGAAAVADMSEEDAVIAIDDDDDGGNEALNNEQEHHQQHLAEVEISGGGGDDEYSVHPPTGVDYSGAGELMVGADIDYAQPDDDHVHNQEVDSVDDQQHPENVMDDFGPTIADEFSALVNSAVGGEHSDAAGSGQSLMISSTGGGDAFDAPPTDFTPIVSISEGDSSHLQRLESNEAASSAPNLHYLDSDILVHDTVDSVSIEPPTSSSSTGGVQPIVADDDHNAPQLKTASANRDDLSDDEDLDDINMEALRKKLLESKAAKTGDGDAGSGTEQEASSSGTAAMRRPIVFDLPTSAGAPAAAQAGTIGLRGRSGVPRARRAGAGSSTVTRGGKNT